MGDLCEIILAHGSLFDGEWTVVRPHNIQSVTAAEQSETEGHIYYRSGGRNQKHSRHITISVRFCSVFLTFPADSLENWECWGPGGEEAR